MNIPGKFKLTIQGWVIVATTLVGIGLAASMVYASEYSAPIDADALRIMVEQAVSTNRETLFFVEQAQGKKVTSTFFAEQEKQLTEHVKNSLRSLQNNHPATGIESKYDRARELLTHTVETLNTLSATAMSDVTSSSPVGDELSTTAEQLARLAQSL